MPGAPGPPWQTSTRRCYSEFSPWLYLTKGCLQPEPQIHEIHVPQADKQNRDRSSMKAGKIWVGHKREPTDQCGRITPLRDRLSVRLRAAAQEERSKPAGASDTQDLLAPARPSG